MRMIRFAMTCLVLLAIAPEVAHSQSDKPGMDELVRVLENDETRAELIRRLRDSSPEVAATGSADAQSGLALRLAERSRDIAMRAADATGEFVTFVEGLRGGMAGANLDAAKKVLMELGAVAVMLFALQAVLRFLSDRILRGVARRCEGARWWGRASAAAFVMFVEAAGVVVAWGGGYLLALNSGAPDRVSIGQAFLLNAFLVIELAKALLRGVLVPRHRSIRLFTADETSVSYWYFWLSRAVSLLGYGFMLVAPAVAAAGAPAAARMVRTLVMLIATAMAVVLVLQNRERGRQFLSRRVDAGRTDSISRLLATAGRFWHAFVLLYLVVLFAVWAATPRNALAFMLIATARTLVAIAVGAIVLGVTRRVLAGGVRLPDDIKQRLPLLEGRLSAFVPAAMRVVRWAVMACVLLAILQIWSIANVTGWLGSEGGRQVVAALVSAAIILLAGGLAYVAVASWIDYRLNPNFGTIPTSRERTLLTLLQNAFAIALSVLVLMLVMSELGVNIGPLLAGAGVLGLAVGFGAQKLVQDIITGVFIQFENVMNEGDVVAAGGVSGVVEKLTIRSVSIRDLSGTLHLVPFSSVGSVSNMMRGFSHHVAEIGVAYRENITEVKEAMQEAFERLKQTEHGESILEPLDMHGVTALGDSAVVVRARIKTLPGKQWGAGRAYNEIIKEVFDARGIEIPFPHLTLYMGIDKQGAAPPLHVAGVPGIAPRE